jgi:hypothetical protein
LGGTLSWGAKKAYFFASEATTLVFTVFQCSSFYMVYTFQHLTTVLRYIPQEIQWNKSDYRALSAHLPTWNNNFMLSNGCIRKGKLLLTEGILASNAPPVSNTLLLHNDHDWSWINLAGSFHLSNFFKLRRKEDEIWVEVCDDFYPQFGAKGRDRFDVLPLLPGKSAGLHINARYWHTLFGARRDTVYLEHCCYLENLGQFEQAELVSNLCEPFALQPQKNVDLRQMMY